MTKTSLSFGDAKNIIYYLLDHQPLSLSLLIASDSFLMV